MYNDLQLKAAKELQDTLVNAEVDARYAKKALEDVDSITNEIKNDQKLLDTLKEFSQSTDKLAETLKNDRNFINQLSGNYVTYGAPVIIKSKRYPNIVTTGGADVYLRPNTNSDSQNWIIENVTSK